MALSIYSVFKRSESFLITECFFGVAVGERLLVHFLGHVAVGIPRFLRFSRAYTREKNLKHMGGRGAAECG